MVCVNKKSYTCLCGCNLTTSTMIFGILFILGGLGSSGSTGGAGFMGIFQILMGGLMTSVLCYPKSEKLRHWIYRFYVVYCIVLLLCFIVVFILVLVVDSFTEDAIADSSYSYSYSSYGYSNYSYYDYDYGYGSGASNEVVENTVRAMYIIVLIIWFLIYCPVTLIGLQIVYWGYKQAEKRNDDKSDEDSDKKKKKKAEKKAKEALAA